MVKIDCDGREEKASHLDSFHYEINSEIAKGSFAFFFFFFFFLGGGGVCECLYTGYTKSTYINILLSFLLKPFEGKCLTVCKGLYQNTFVALVTINECA